MAPPRWLGPRRSANMSRRNPTPVSHPVHEPVQSQRPRRRSAMPALTVTTRAEAERDVAHEVVALVADAARQSAPCVLGLATGGTMVGVYAAIVAEARARSVSFAHVDTVNLDEYLGLGPEHPRSFAAFMREHLFRHLDLEPGRC